MIDQFTLKDFETFLENHKPYETLGIVDGEHCYKLILDGQSAIMLRSSIGVDGVAAMSGKNSVRLWLIGNDGKPLGSKIDSWTQRIPGWQDRLFDKIYELVTRRMAAGDCRECGKPFGIYKRKSDGVLFAKCFPCSKRLRKNINGNLDNPGWFSLASQMRDVEPLITRKDIRDLASIMQDKGHSNIASALDEFLSDPFAENDDKPKFKPSKYQEAIYEFVRNGKGHAVVMGVAGCGKTTTNVEALKLVTAKTKYAAFNKHIERDISAKAPSHVSVSTFHSWGLNNIKKVYPKIKVNQWKIHNLIDDKAPKIERDFKNEVVKTVGLLKGNLLEPTQDNIMQLTCDFGLDIAENDCAFIRQVFLDSIKDIAEIDFNDMPYYPAAGIVPCEKFDYIFVDEAQDMNTSQYVLCKKSLAENGRMLLIGDPQQSIYAFRGAHTGIMDFMADEMNAIKLPLTISYRAPLAIVAHVNAHYPHITFEASETAKNGKIEWIDFDQFYSTINQSDGVLCRMNAPLVEPCFSLIRRGIKATILGRDIGEGLIKLVEKRERLKRVHSLDDLLEQVSVYCSNERKKAIKQKNQSRMALLEDQEATIFALSADCRTIQDLKQKTKDTFSDQKEGVTFSTVHKAKGLEWQRVFVIGPKGNHPMGDKEQETNIRYVRDTRTLDELYFVGE